MPDKSQLYQSKNGRLEPIIDINIHLWVISEKLCQVGKQNVWFSWRGID